MKHRIATVLGNNDTRFNLDNTGEINETFASAAIKEYFGYWEGCDFHVDKKQVVVGVEPSYQGDDLLVVAIHKDIDKSAIQTGHAFGHYGTGVRKRTKTYAEYKRNSKFKKFVDKWHPILFPKATRTQ